MPISLCMIVKDEEKYLEQCLNSVKSIVDEIIIVDTGSTDKTKEIAAKFNAKIIDFEWNNNTSDARNVSLQNATKDWILVLDADETIDEADLEKIKRLIKDKSVMGYRLIQNNYTSNSNVLGWQPCINNKNRTNPRAKARGIYRAVFGIENCRTKVRGIKPTIFNNKTASGFFPTAIVRLFQNNKNIQYEYAAHEIVENSIGRLKGKIAKADIKIHHYGYIRKDRNAKTRAEHYLKLSLEDIKKKPNDPRAYNEIGLILANKGKLKEALPFLKKVIELNPFNIESYINLGAVYQKTGMADQAIKILKAALTINNSIPNNSMPDVYTNLGTSYLMKGENKDAIGCLKKAIELNPNNPLNYDNLGAAYANENEIDNAEQAFRKAIELNNNDSLALSNMGIIQIKKGNAAEAEELLLRAINCNDKNINAYYNLGIFYLEKEQPEKAKNILNKALKLFPSNEEIKSLLKKCQ